MDFGNAVLMSPSQTEDDIFCSWKRLMDACTNGGELGNSAQNKFPWVQQLIAEISWSVHLSINLSFSVIHIIYLREECHGIITHIITKLFRHSTKPTNQWLAFEGTKILIFRETSLIRNPNGMIQAPSWENKLNSPDEGKLLHWLKAKICAYSSTSNSFPGIGSKHALL